MEKCISNNSILIGFQIIQLDLRGTFDAMYNYAKYAEIFFKNKCIFFIYKSFYDPERDIIPFLKLQKRFEVFFYENKEDLKRLIAEKQLNYIYIIKWGKRHDNELDDLRSTQSDNQISTTICKQIIHCVYDMSEPHGDIYVGVSRLIAEKYGKTDFIPHMIGLKKGDKNNNLRKLFNIPENATVFGRHGGGDTYDLDFVKNVIQKIVDTNRSVYFLFMNTGPTHIGIEEIKSPNIIFLPPTVDNNEKNRFINTCDAMLHAQRLGESFGIAIGEFSVNEKPIIIYGGKVWNDNYKKILGKNAIYYTNEEELYKILCNFIVGKADSRVNGVDDYKIPNNTINCYTDYTPEKVMKKWSEYIN